MPDLGNSFTTGVGKPLAGTSGGGNDGALAARRSHVDQGFAQQLARILANEQVLNPLLQARATGADAPFSPAAVAALRADVTDSTGGELARAQRQIRRGFSNALAGGVSGGQISALNEAARRAAAASRQGMRDVDTRTSVENFGAKERGQQALGAFQQDQTRAAADRLAQLIAFNSRFEVTGDSPFNAGGAARSGGGLGAGIGAGASSDIGTGWTGYEQQDANLAAGNSPVPGYENPWWLQQPRPLKAAGGGVGTGIDPYGPSPSPGGGPPSYLDPGFFSTPKGTGSFGGGLNGVQRGTPESILAQYQNSPGGRPPASYQGTGQGPGFPSSAFPAKPRINVSAGY